MGIRIQDQCDFVTLAEYVWCHFLPPIDPKLQKQPFFLLAIFYTQNTWKILMLCDPCLKSNLVWIRLRLGKIFNVAERWGCPMCGVMIVYVYIFLHGYLCYVLKIARLKLCCNLSTDTELLSQKRKALNSGQGCIFPITCQGVDSWAGWLDPPFHKWFSTHS